MTDSSDISQTAEDGEYRVLARKYRPSTFDELIGQDALVRTLTNAIASGRLAHAFMLTGVRGIGKTTTARIIARALNCIGPDGTGDATIEPCGVCENCIAIAADRHVDVMEMDAASRTGVDDIRELIEGVRYRPVSARYKVYIIDEVHMLSKNAFNALLKTLEEPPEHVKFIFATTEIRKVPVTVLSRCQRFDLRRIDMDTLSEHFKKIVDKEGASVSEPALHMIARAADGSVRDGLSLLDQAIAHTDGNVEEDQVRDMLGLADRSLTFDLMDFVMKGATAEALELLDRQYVAGADPVVVIEDMLELTHWLTRIKITPSAADGAGVPETERVRGKEMAEALTMPVLARGWQMLLKGLSEARQAPSPLQATEMILVRLAYAADLPSPADAVKQMQNQPQTQQQPQPPAGGGGQAPAGGGGGMGSQGPSGSVHGPTMSGGSAAVAVAPNMEVSQPSPQTFEQVVALTEDMGEMILHANLLSNVHLVAFEPGRIEFRPGDTALPDLPHNLGTFLTEHTDRRWVVSISNDAGAPTLKQQGDAKDAAEKAQIATQPLVNAVLKAFPGAEIKTIKTLAPIVEEAPIDAQLDDED